jgi:hypothetical protein
MRTRWTVVAALALVAAWLATGRGTGADEKEIDFAAIMKLHTPGEAHKALQPLVGTWQAKVKMYAKPGEAAESEGTMVRKWILDGRFLEEKFEGNFGGLPFKGIGLTGHDNIKKKYTGLWVDSISTSMITSEGTYDADAKTFTYTAEHYDPQIKAKVKTRDVVRLIDADTIEQKMYKTPPDGKETMTMEISYTRKAK